MKYFSSTPSTVFVLQIFSLLMIISGIFFVDVSYFYIGASVVFFYLYSVVGISLMLHRYYSHKNFKLNNFLKTAFTFIAVLAGRGSPLGWTYVHRIHHSAADTEKDPHSPHFDTFKFIGFKPAYDTKKQINYFIIKDLLSPFHINIDKYYVLIILLFLVVLLIIDINLIFYIWAVPVFIVSVTQTMFNYFAHKFGYRNFNTRDKSTNCIFLWPFILGDAWHNNHHHNAANISTKIKWWEFDPLVPIIKLINQENK